ncbi:hypothetical protein C2845_PM05G17800 [Panicum miliaceum]|uniref:Uncharacterized protein n=1 Tax=Panicum miliaceum TaxID=4540 RepID=A0A3L6T1W2_PANMI|nr:hypothetical protein C2845_PM05G17800 [Panicum miliaceum]
MTFTFGFWICIASGRDGFNSHLIDTREPETFAPVSSRDIDDLSEIQFSDLIGNHEGDPTRLPLVIASTQLASTTFNCSVRRCVRPRMTRAATAAFLVARSMATTTH